LGAGYLELDRPQWAAQIFAVASIQIHLTHVRISQKHLVPGEGKDISSVPGLWFLVLFQAHGYWFIKQSLFAIPNLLCWLKWVLWCCVPLHFMKGKSYTSGRAGEYARMQAQTQYFFFIWTFGSRPSRLVP
jgi:hypothetical protein